MGGVSSTTPVVAVNLDLASKLKGVRVDETTVSLIKTLLTTDKASCRQDVVNTVMTRTSGAESAAMAHD